jgi:hypothetical protein
MTTDETLNHIIKNEGRCHHSCNTCCYSIIKGSSGYANCLLFKKGVKLGESILMVPLYYYMEIGAKHYQSIRLLENILE